MNERRGRMPMRGWLMLGVLITLLSLGPVQAIDLIITGSGSTGDITAVGSCPGGECFTPAAPALSLWWGVQAAPAAPSAGQGLLYVDSTTQNLALKDAAGVVKHGVRTTATVLHQFLTGIAADGQVSQAQPALATLSDAATVLTATSTHDVANKFVIPSELPLAIVSNGITPDCNTPSHNIVPALTAPLTIHAPGCAGPKPYPSQDLTLRFFSAAPQALTWNAAYTFADGIPAPTSTTGDGLAYNHIKFRYNSVTGTWRAMASTFPTTSASTVVSRHLPVTGVKFNDGVNSPATPDRSGLKDLLLFDNATKQCVVWQFQLPIDYTGSPVLGLQYMMLSALGTGGIAFEIDIWHHKAGESVTTASYDTINPPCITPTVAGNYLRNLLTCPLTTVDSWVAGESVNLRLCRAISHPSDTADGLLGLYGAELRYAR